VTEPTWIIRVASAWLIAMAAAQNAAMGGTVDAFRRATASNVNFRPVPPKSISSTTQALRIQLHHEDPLGLG
jgi:hypothetical protein